MPKTDFRRHEWHQPILLGMMYNNSQTKRQKVRERAFVQTEKRVTLWASSETGGGKQMYR
jgi:hypothetical protein